MAHSDDDHRAAADEGCVLALDGERSDIDALHRFLEGASVRFGWNARTQHHLTLACEELLTNIVSYGYPHGGVPRIRLSAAATARGARLVLEDNAVAFDPLGQPDPDLSLDLDSRPIGGLGVYFVKRVIDDVHYERLPSGNRLTMIKFE
ncbi:ATP-binding protein [Cohnella sp. JJ-181]|uniref:ATP-binding protein n=1 Tax=Cohnella rhizoplanae TaxID=2974897 RepID=UPI0022FFAD46|nr:ATP-binding protein [Cohnella sp. JJ-181]CAI6081368.1 Serine/threonine-protein kinase BtrW [Cohnella sp. JJ-181]